MSNQIKLLITILALLLSFSNIAEEGGKEDCSYDGIGFKEEANIAKVYFYTGTCHYRNADYEQSAEEWKKLALLEEVAPEFSDLQIDVLNNLGYLKFFGLGIEENKTEAVSYWEKAVGLGHEESEYHLCHAYADIEQITYAPKKAYSHCQKALMIYSNMENRQEDNEIAYQQTKKYMNFLKSLE